MATISCCVFAASWLRLCASLCSTLCFTNTVTSTDDLYDSHREYVKNVYGTTVVCSICCVKGKPSSFSEDIIIDMKEEKEVNEKKLKEELQQQQQEQCVDNNNNNNNGDEVHKSNNSVNNINNRVIVEERNKNVSSICSKKEGQRSNSVFRDEQFGYCTAF